MNKAEPTILHSSSLDTPLGPMVVMADSEALYLLEFIDRRALAQALQKLHLHNTIVEGSNLVIAHIKKEIKAYFDGTLTEFQTPLKIFGTPFQKLVWNALMQIPFGETRSYLEQAELLHKPTACRAVANANGRNQLAIVVPCHRVINQNGGMGGYGGGLPKKVWLLEHEKRNRTSVLPAAIRHSGLDPESTTTLTPKDSGDSGSSPE